MPWFAIAYVTLLVAVGIYSVYDDRRLGRTSAYLLVDGVVTLAWIWFVLAYFYPGLAAPLGRGAALLLLLTVLWTAADAVRATRELVRERADSYDPEFSARANLWIDRGVEGAAAILGTLVIVPALAAALLVVGTTW